ncbi:hypothetical protein AGLY_016329 [Aphis glycines]|uniref:MULE transposase domain-containing protein n=1 Tax=Aphis glycines TaxID=307491 RepID=A0A6G0T0C5_APHGL|nr:hypothetical protein AGLY_016329 [Aphis glycines]
MENELIMSTMLSEKGEILKVVNDFKFGCHKNFSNGDIRWRCTNKNCRAFLRIDAEDKIKVSATITDISERPSKLFHTQLKEENVPTLTITDVTYIKNNMHYARRTSYPQLPNNINEVHSILNRIEIKTIDNEQFLFSCQSNLCFFSEISVFYVDGTFDYCTKFFCQLFAIHGLHNDKQTLSYFEVFKAINHEITKINPTFTPKIIYVDFEKAINNAINRIWPTTLIRARRLRPLAVVGVMNCGRGKGWLDRFCFIVGFLRLVRSVRNTCMCGKVFAHYVPRWSPIRVLVAAAVAYS